MSKHTAPTDLTTSIEVPASRGPLRSVAKAAVLPWIALWGWVAVDSALTYRKSREAIDTAIEADPIAELYDGPQEQSAASSAGSCGRRARSTGCAACASAPAPP